MNRKIKSQMDRKPSLKDYKKEEGEFWVEKRGQERKKKVQLSSSVKHVTA